MIRKILFLFVFCLPSLAFGQVFESVVSPDQYTGNGSTYATLIPKSNDLAVLHFRYHPFSGNVSVDFVEIIPSTELKGKHVGVFGYSIDNNTGDDSTSYREWFTVCSASTLYTRVNDLNLTLRVQIQRELEKKHLGTVQQRAAYISSFKLSNVSIIDTSKIVESIVAMLGPWANICIGIAIALFGIDLGTRKSKKIAGQAAKEARAAERREINRQIRNDGKAKGYRLTLSILAQAKRGDIDVGMSRRQARRKFEEVAADYAAYKRKRGWTS